MGRMNGRDKFLDDSCQLAIPFCVSGKEKALLSNHFFDIGSCILIPIWCVPYIATRLDFGEHMLTPFAILCEVECCFLTILGGHTG